MAVVCWRVFLIDVPERGNEKNGGKKANGHDLIFLFHEMMFTFKSLNASSNVKWPAMDFVI